MQVLLEHGTDVNARDVKQCTPLYDAAYIGEQQGSHHGSYMAFSCCCCCQLSASLQCSRLTTRLWPHPLVLPIGGCMACRCTGHPSCVRLLLSFGADAGLADDKGRCPLRVVCKWEFADHRHKDEINDLLLVGSRWPACLSASYLNFSSALAFLSRLVRTSSGP